MSTFIGIDVGSSLVKVVQIEYKGKLYLRSYFLFPTPYTSSKKIDTQEFYNQIVAHIPPKIFAYSYVGINIPSSPVTVMVINLPKMSRKELEIAAIAEAKRKMLPAPGPNSRFEYLVLGEVIIGKIPRYEVLVIKTEKECIDEALGVLDKFSLNYPPFISPTCSTVINIFSQNSPFHRKETAFIDIGYNSIDITVTKAGNLCFFRNIKFGLKEIIAHFSNNLNISSQETERVIKEKGVPQINNIDLSDRVKVAEEIMRQKYEASLTGGSSEEVNPLELRLLWQTEVEKIITEIRRTLVYYKEVSEGGRVENIFFLGGGSIIKGLIPQLTKEIGGNCQLLNSFREAEVFLGDDHPGQIEEGALFAPSLSLALSNILLRKKKRVIDFLPYQLKRQEVIIHRQIVAVVFTIFLLCFIVLAALNVFINNRMLKNAIEDKNFKIRRMESVLETLDSLKQERENIERKSAKVKEILRQRLPLTRILDDVIKRMPREVFMEEFLISEEGINKGGEMMPGGGIIEQGSEEMMTEEGQPTTDQGSTSQKKKYRIKMKLACFADYEKAVNQAKIFKKKLEMSPYFTNIELIPPKLEKITLPGGGQAATLTPVKKIEFSLKAEVNTTTDEGF